MSPVPEPMQGGRGNPGDGDEISPPSGLVMGPPISSSDEEPDQADLDDPNLSGYQPLPQHLDDEQDDDLIDYTSVNGLMAALNTHGPSVIEGETIEEEAEDSNLGESQRIAEQGSVASSQTSELIEQASRDRHSEEAEEQAALWNSLPTDRLNLDGNKVEEIKSVMASFTLPQSAIPQWAQNISDEDWKNQIAGLLSRQGSQ